MEEQNTTHEDIKKCYKKWRNNLCYSNIYLWSLCRTAYDTYGQYSNKDIFTLSQYVGIPPKNLVNFVMAGKLIRFCENIIIEDDYGMSWSLFSMWQTGELTFDDLLDASKTLNKCQMYPVDTKRIVEKLFDKLDKPLL